MYLYCLAVEAGCYSDIVEFAVRSVSGFPEFTKVSESLQHFFEVQLGFH